MSTKKSPQRRSHSSIALVGAGILLSSFTLAAAQTPTETVYAQRVLGDSTDGENLPSAPLGMGDQQRPPEPPQLNIQQNGTKQEGEIQQNGQTIKWKREDSGALKIEQEQQQAKEKDFLEKEGLHIATDDGHISFEHQGVRAETHFPLSVNTTTNQLQVNTPAGTKSVTVLPDQAVQNLMGQGVTPSTSSGGLTPPVQLDMHNGELNYQVQGQQQLRLFGLIPISVPTTTFVSPQTGQVTAQEQSLLSSILKFFSR